MVSLIHEQFNSTPTPFNCNSTFGNSASDRNRRAGSDKEAMIHNHNHDITNVKNYTQHTLPHQMYIISNELKCNAMHAKSMLQSHDIDSLDHPFYLAKRFFPPIIIKNQINVNPNANIHFMLFSGGDETHISLLWWLVLFFSRQPFIITTQF